MYIVLLIVLLSTFFAYLRSAGIFKYGLEVAFSIITVFLAIRYEWGNDYDTYISLYKNINSSNLLISDWKEFYLISGRFEIGWVVLNILCKPIGFFGLIILSTVIENFVLYNFVKKHVPEQVYWMSIFIYTASSVFMCIGASMMREWLAICIVIYAYEFILQKKPVVYACLILLASSFHTSALFIIPLYFITFLKKIQLKRYHLVYLVIGYTIIAIALSQLLQKYMEVLLAFSSFENYNRYVGSQDNGFAIGNSVIVLLDLYCLANAGKFDNKNQKLVFICALSSLTYTVTGKVVLADRIGYYLLVSQIAVFPMVFGTTKSQGTGAKILLLLYLCIVVRGFFLFFSSKIWMPYFNEYQTIFSTNWQ